MKKLLMIKNNLNKFCTSERAFTLVELLLSLFILALITIPTFTFFMNSILMNKANDIEERALYIAQQEIERAKRVDFDSLESIAPVELPELTGYPVFTVTRVVIDDSNPAPDNYPVSDSVLNDSDLKAVFILVTWGEDGEKVLKTIISRDG